MVFWSLIVNISACICIRLSLSRHSHFVFLQKLRMKFHMYINFRTHQTVARSWRELKMFVFWEHWFGIASIMAWRLIRVLKVFKGNHRKFSVIGSQDKWIKMRFVFVCNPMDCNPIGSSVHGIFSQQEYWSGLPFLPPEDLPDPGIKPASSVAPVLQVDSLPLSHWGSE